MKILAIYLSVLFAHTAAAQDAVNADVLLGRWEQDVRNCVAPIDGNIPHVLNDDKSLSNMVLTFDALSGVQKMNEFSHESGEGLNCEIVSLLHSSPYRFSAKCSSYDMPMEPGIITAKIVADTVSISFVGDEFDSHAEITYYRCE